MKLKSTGNLDGRAVEEWIGKTPDSRPPERVVVRVFDRASGICHISGRKILATDKWEVEHIKPLKAGGENRESNLAPALVEPHKKKTAEERKITAKISRTRKKHIGVTKKRKHKWPKRKFGQ